MTSKLTILGKLENDGCQANARVLNPIEMIFELRRHGCPYLVEDLSEHPQTVGLENYRTALSDPLFWASMWRAALFTMVPK